MEIDARAARKNYDTFRGLIGARGAGKKPQLWSVVKSNAYGHGLYAFSAIMDEIGIDGFCVDSVVEALALRKPGKATPAGIKKPILVLGQTLPSRYAEAAAKDVTISISNFEALNALRAAAHAPNFHVKIDTGMHRQGFYGEDIPRVIALIKKKGLTGSVKGLYTHFASAKDINYPTFTDEQLKNFKKAVALFEKAGFKNLTKHVSATGGALIDKKYHLDAVRVGIGLYGLWPSKELEIQLADKIQLHPVLSWRTMVSETKKVHAGDYVGYDLTERISKDTGLGILPIGYWHGFPRALSSRGEVLVRGRRARVLGRVSMDMVAVELPAGGRQGDVVTLIGRDARQSITANEQAMRADTVAYELLTRLNPLMERVIIR